MFQSFWGPQRAPTPSPSESNIEAVADGGGGRTSESVTLGYHRRGSDASVAREQDWNDLYENLERRIAVAVCGEACTGPDDDGTSLVDGAAAAGGRPRSPASRQNEYLPESLDVKTHGGDGGSVVSALSNVSIARSEGGRGGRSPAASAASGVSAARSVRSSRSAGSSGAGGSIAGLSGLPGATIRLTGAIPEETTAPRTDDPPAREAHACGVSALGYDDSTASSGGFFGANRRSYFGRRRGELVAGAAAVLAFVLFVSLGVEYGAKGAGGRGGTDARTYTLTIPGAGGPFFYDEDCPEGRGRDAGRQAPLVDDRRLRRGRQRRRGDGVADVLSLGEDRVADLLARGEVPSGLRTRRRRARRG